MFRQRKKKKKIKSKYSNVETAKTLLSSVLSIEEKKRGFEGYIWRTIHFNWEQTEKVREST